MVTAVPYFFWLWLEKIIEFCSTLMGTRGGYRDLMGRGLFNDWGRGGGCRYHQCPKKCKLCIDFGKWVFCSFLGGVHHHPAPPVDPALVGTHLGMRPKMGTHVTFRGNFKFFAWIVMVTPLWLFKPVKDIKNYHLTYMWHISSLKLSFAIRRKSIVIFWCFFGHFQGKFFL